MPEPKSGENEQAFVSRCIPILVKEGKKQDQAQGQCFGMYRDWKKKNNQGLSETSRYEGLIDTKEGVAAKVFLTLDMKDAITETVQELEDDKGKYTLIKATSITEGKWNDLFYPADVIENANNSADGVQLRLNHSTDVKDVISLISNPVYDPTIKGTRIESKVYHDEVDPKYLARLKNGTWKDVSAGLHLEIRNNDKKEPYAATMIYDHIGIVTKGACTDAKTTEVLNSAVTDLNNKLNEVSKLEEIDKLKEDLVSKEKDLEEAKTKAGEQIKELEKLKADNDKLTEEKKKLEEGEEKEDDKKEDDKKDDDKKDDDKKDDDKDKDSENAKLQEKVDKLQKEMDSLISIGERHSKMTPPDEVHIVESNLHIENGEIYEV